MDVHRQNNPRLSPTTARRRVAVCLLRPHVDHPPSRSRVIAGLAARHGRTLISGHGQIIAEYFDAGTSRRIPGDRPPYGSGLADAGPHPNLPTPVGADGCSASHRTPAPRRPWPGYSGNVSPATASPASPGTSTNAASPARPAPTATATATE